MNLPLPSDRIREEMIQITALINSISTAVENVDMPMNDERQELYQLNLKSELILAGQRLILLSELIG